MVQCDSAERVCALDAKLWSYAEESFLPHGIDGADAAEQPVLLTTLEHNPNEAHVSVFD